MSLPPDYWIKQMRAELEKRKAGLCTHGVPHHACRDHEPAARKPETEEHA